MGNDLALAVLSDQQAAPLQLLQAALRAGDEPADRLDPRGDRDERRDERRLRAQPARRDARARAPARDRASRSCATRELESLRQVDSSIFKAHTIDITWPVGEGADGLAAALERICAEADRVLARRRQHPDPLRPRASAPSACRSRRCSPSSAVHHHLVREGTRLQAGPRRRVGRAARGAPLRDADRLRRRRGQPVRDARVARPARRRGRPPSDDEGRGARRARSRAIAKGLLKTMSKMGISTIPSYCGAQIFEAVGLAPGARRPALHRHAVADRRASALDVLAREALDRHARAYPARTASCCRVGGVYAWRARRRAPPVEPGDDRAPAARRPPRRAARPTRSTRRQVNEDAARQRDAARPARLRVPRRRRHPARRGRAGGRDRQALRRPARCRSARSAREAHETLAIAMNRIGGKSNTGEGGEDPARYIRDAERRLAALGDQAGRVRPLRREHPLPRQRRRAPDQDGAGREARRGRPAAGPQGRRLHRRRSASRRRASG